MAKTFFISGANRGIGLGYIKNLVKRPNVKIIASARDVDASTDLLKLRDQHDSLNIVKLDVNSDESIDSLSGQLKDVASDGIDTFVSVAGIHHSHYTIKDTPRQVWNEHIRTNTLGPIFLYQALYPYMIKKETRQIIFVSALVGSIGGFFPTSCSAYGLSKAALNYASKELSYELNKEKFTVISMHPGLVRTDLTKKGLKDMTDEKIHKQYEKLSIEPEYSAERQLELIDSLTRESNGKFLSYEGKEIKW
ncbi:Uncharacterized protein ABC855_g2802 [[Candida] zeylanoides]